MAQPLQFYNININDGLNANSINAIIQDKNGFIWMATSDGICRYDGHNFKQYHDDKYKPNSLHSSIYVQLQEDDYGNIWLDGEKNIEVIEAKTGNIKLVTSYSLKTNIAAEYTFYKTLNKDTLIHVSPDFNIFYFNTKTLEPINNFIIRINANALSSKKISSSYGTFTLPNNDTIYFLNNSCTDIVKFNYRNKSIKYTSCNIGKNLDLYSSPTILSNNSIGFVARENNDLFFIEINKESFTIIRKTFIKSINATFNYIGNSCVYEDYKNNRLYLGIYGEGLFVYDSTLQFLNKYTYDGSNPRSIASNLFFSGIKKFDDAIWILTNPTGVTYSNTKANAFNSYSSSIGLQDISKGIFTDKKGNVYNLPVGICLKYYDAKTGINITNTLPQKTQNFFKTVEYSSFNSTTILNENEVVIYTPNNLFIYNHTEGSFINFNPWFIKNLFAKNNIRYCQAFPINNRQILLEVNQELVELILNNDGTCTIKNKEKYPHDISAIHVAKNGNYFIGTTAGLYLKKQGGKISHVKQTDNILIKCIMQASDNSIYVATLSGVFHLKDDGSFIEQLHTGNGLTNNFCYGLLEDDAKQIWISNNKGLCRYNALTKQMSFYTKEDGLQGNEFNSNAYYKDKNGKLYFGGIYGVTAINISLLSNTKNNIKPKLIALAVNDVWINRDTSIWNIPKWTFSHTENTLTFEFASMKLINNSTYSYLYKLEGYDKNWITSLNNNIIRYPDLPPGNYTFLLKTVQNKIESETTNLVSIKIKPAFYQTWWFYLLLLAASIFCIWKIVQYFTKRKYKKQLAELRLQQELETERQRISRDLHDNMGAYTSALIANVQQLKNKTGDTDDVQKMEGNAEQILASLRETIWVLNNKEVSVQEFSDGFKNYCFKILKNFEQLSFSATEKIENNKMLSAATAIHLNKIMQEAVQNIIKHANATQINYTIESNIKFVITIADNGVGFDEIKVIKGNGLDNMEWRAKEVGLELKTISTINKGTTILINTL